MGDDNIGKYIEMALAEVVRSAKKKKSDREADLESKIKEGIIKISPLLKMIEEMENQTRNIKGLEIKVAKHRHLANISMSEEWGVVKQLKDYCVLMSRCNKYFVLETNTRYKHEDFPAETHHYKEEFDNISEIMEKIIEGVGEFIADQQETSNA